MTYYGKYDFIEVKDATAWIQRNLVGNITKQLLDDQRMIEINELDMMQNSSIIYNTEVVLEMQILATLLIFFTHS